MSESVAPWLVSAKVSPPRQLVNTCRRKLLLKRLLENTLNPVTVLEAPAGFGKTLLLSQWREELKANAYLVAWSSIDGSEDADIIIPYIAYAFQKAGVDMGETGLLSPSFHGVRTAYSLGRLLNRIENSEKQCVLMLDDVERTSDVVISDVIESLIRLQPDNLYLVIACRQNPGISLSNLSVQGSLTLLGPQEMRFNMDEIGDLFGQTLDSKEVKMIYERTDGWPVAVQLLKSFIAGSDALTTVLSTFTGTSKEVAGYFREQLLESLPGNAHCFLEEVSILDPIHLDCANYIRGATDSQILAHELHYLEGIFAPLEGDDETYRLHPLVSEYLAEALRESDKERYKKLCRLTALWLAEREQSLEAMRYALQAEDTHLAGQIFEQMSGGPQLWLLEGMSRLRTGLHLLANHNIDVFPRIHLARSLIHAKEGQMKKARQSFDLASTLSNGFEKDRKGGDNIALLIDRYIIESMLTEYGCSPPTEASKQDALQFIQDNVDDNTIIHAYIMTLQCLTHMQSGLFEECLRFGNKAIKNFQENGSRYGELFIYFHFGMSHLVRTEIDLTLAEYEKAYRMARSEFPGDVGLKRICDVVLGEFFWEIGDVSQSGKHLKRILSDVQHLEAWFDIYMAGYQTTAEYILYESGIDAALSFLNKAKKHAIEQELVRLETFLNAVRANVHYFAGKIDQSFDYNSNIDKLLDDPRVQTTWREIETICLAYSRMAISYSDYKLARSRINYLMNVAKKTENSRLKIYALIQLSIIDNYSGDQINAISGLKEAIDIAKHGKYIRPFLQEILRLQPILDSIQTDSQINPAEQEFITVIREKSINPYKKSDLAAAFSTREIEILNELSKGESDKHIARAIGMTPHGVRYHLKKIYTKLGVSNRMQAINKSRHSGLINTAS